MARDILYQIISGTISFANITPAFVLVMIIAAAAHFVPDRWYAAVLSFIANFLTTPKPRSSPRSPWPFDMWRARARRPSSIRDSKNMPPPMFPKKTSLAIATLGALLLLLDFAKLARPFTLSEVLDFRPRDIPNVEPLAPIPATNRPVTPLSTRLSSPI